MSLYGHTNINIDSLKRWANALSIDNITEVIMVESLFFLMKSLKKY